MDLTCFKTYDIRGKLGENFDGEIVKQIARAFALHLDVKRVIIGFDARETSETFANIFADAIKEFGADALLIGLSGTEEMYWAVSEYGASGGVQVTASHNPIDYNGLKMVKAGSQPLDNEKDFRILKKLAGKPIHFDGERKGKKIDKSRMARIAYVEKILSFVDLKKFRPLKIVFNSGNGAAGPALDKILSKLEKESVFLDIFRINHNPNSDFPNGIPNPMLKENQQITSEAVLKYKADLGVAFDGDFDRCFFFDETGRFLPSEYLVGLFAQIFLKRNHGSRIVFEPRLIRNTLEIIKDNGGVGVMSRTGHVFMKKEMRKHDAIYGGEISAHHYFRDFAFCDSGMIPWLLLVEHLSEVKEPLSFIFKDRFEKFPSSGEQNFLVEDPNSIINFLAKKYEDCGTIDHTDGLSVNLQDWRFNIRKSNTEPYLRLNVEGMNAFIVEQGVKKIVNVIKSGR